MAEQNACCGGVGSHEEWCPTHIRSALTWIEPSLDGIRLRERAEVALQALIERDGLKRNAVTLPDVLPLARRLYKDASIGCCLHEPLASGTMDVDALGHSIQVAQIKHHGHCEMLARILLRMTDAQRERLVKEVRK